MLPPHVWHWLRRKSRPAWDKFLPRSAGERSITAKSRRLFVLLLLPVRLAQRILDVAVLGAIDVIRPRLMEGPHQPQARLLHHASGGGVDRHRPREHTLHAEFGEALADQRARPFGGVALAPGRFAQPVAKLDVVEAGALGWPEVEPAQKLPGGLLDGRPKAIAREALVVVEKGRQEVVLDLLARGRSSSVDEVHDVWVAVEIYQIIHIGLGEPAQQQPTGLQEDPHRPILQGGIRLSEAVGMRRSLP